MEPEFHVGLLPNRPVSEVVELAVAAEEFGFDGVWIADSQSVFRDAYIALALAADRTERIKLAPGVTNPVTRHPAVLAGSIATLAEHSNGRAILGIGVGESAVRTVGLPPAKLRRLEEVTLAIRSLLAGEAAHYDGTELKLSWPTTEVPVIYSSSGPRSLRLGGRVADGVLFQVGAHPALVSYGLANIRAGVEEAGRNRTAVTRLMRLACSVSYDRARAREEARGYIATAAGTVYWAVPHEHVPADVLDDLERMKARYDYSKHAAGDAEHASFITDRIIDAISVVGTPDEVIPRFRELAGFGIDGFVLPITTPDPKATMRLLANEVIPHVQGSES